MSSCRGTRNRLHAAVLGAFGIHQSVLNYLETPLSLSIYIYIYIYVLCLPWNSLNCLETWLRLPGLPISGQTITQQKSQKWNFMGKCYWKSIVEFQWKSTRKVNILWKVPLKGEHMLETAAENPLWFLRCWFLVCNLLPLGTSPTATCSRRWGRTASPGYIYIYIYVYISLSLSLSYIYNMYM